MIVVTAPTSLIGSQVLDQLIGAGAPVRVIARDPSRLPSKTRDQVEVVTGSHSDHDTVSRAFAGAQAVFWLVPPDPRAPSVTSAYVDFTRPASAAMRQRGVARVVGVSALGRGTPMAAHAGLVTGSLAMDDLIGSSGVAYRALTMPSFMDNLARQIPLIREQGMFTSPISGDRTLPSVATRDIASVAARWLADDSWTGVQEVPVLGPEDISFKDMERMMTDILDRPIRFQQVSPESYRDRMMQFGMTRAMAQGMLDMALAKDAGLDSAARRVSDNSSTSFGQWCQDTLKPAVLGGGTA